MPALINITKLHQSAICRQCRYHITIRSEQVNKAHEVITAFAQEHASHTIISPVYESEGL